MKKASILLVTLMLALGVGVLSGCSFNKAYTPEPGEQMVNNDLLHTPGTLRVGVDASNAPYAAESQGAIVGIDVDVAAALADALGLKLELVDVGSSASQAFESEDVDIVMGVSPSVKDCWVSKPYFSSAIVLFAGEEGADVPKDGDVYAVAAQASSMSAFEVGSRLGEDKLDATADIQAVFEHLENGTANYIATDSTIGSYVAHSNGVTIYPVALLADETNYCIAAPTTAAGLQDAVADALSKLSDGGVLSVIAQKWLGTQIAFDTLTVIEPIPAATADDTADDDTDDDED